ncbi:hypothetical protein ACSMXM_05705 [Pacificimonas sp. ICDLI1SI03]
MTAIRNSDYFRTNHRPGDGRVERLIRHTLVVASALALILIGVVTW